MTLASCCHENLTDGKLHDLAPRCVWHLSVAASLGAPGRSKHEDYGIGLPLLEKPKGMLPSTRPLHLHSSSNGSQCHHDGLPP